MRDMMIAAIVLGALALIADGFCLMVALIEGDWK